METNHAVLVLCHGAIGEPTCIQKESDSQLYLGVGRRICDSRVRLEQAQRHLDTFLRRDGRTKSGDCL